MPRRVPLWKTPLPWVCLVMGLQALLVVAFIANVLRNRRQPSPPLEIASAPAQPKSGGEPVSASPPALPGKTPAPQKGGLGISVNDALGRDWVAVSYRGNAREKLAARLLNRTEKPLSITFLPGMLFESQDRPNQVVLVRGDTVPLAPGETREVGLLSAATRASNQVGNHVFLVRPGRLPQLDTLLTHLEKNPEVSAEAIQTAVLVILENPPISAFAKFTLVSGVAPGPTPATPPPAHFKVATLDIVAALALLKEIDLPQRDLVLATEPQLKVEALIDPLAHADALRYYGITPSAEWDYWRDELLNGDVSTRHYALYGIARYFPDTALQMLPQWAREKTLAPVMRSASVLAMAETGRVEAISVLQQLAYEFGSTSELGQNARAAIGFLENRRDRPAAARPAIEFKDAPAPPPPPVAAAPSQS